MPDRLVDALVDHLIDLRVIARIPEPRRAKVIRAAVVLEQMTAFLYDDEEDEEIELAELLLAADVGLETRQAIELLGDLRLVLDGAEPIAERSPDLRHEAALRDVAERLVAACKP